MRLPLAKEGIPFVVVAVLLVLPALWWARWHGWGLRAAVPIALGAAALLVVWFFRDPDRRPPPGELLAVSPADGKVLSVGPAPLAGDDFLEGAVGEAATTRVTIFLSVFDVHVQRAPLAGTVRGYAHRAGRYLAAWKSEASRQNEQASLAIETTAGTVIVRQIAGLVARRIVTYPRPDNSVERGERIGLIRFGSRVDLFVPADWRIEVAPGDRVRGGETVVAAAPGAGP